MEDYGIEGGQGRDADDVMCAAKWFCLLLAIALTIVLVMTGCKLDLPILR